MPGHVAERRGLAPALGEAAAGLALEVDDRHVALRDQHLPEVVVAVDARAAAGGRQRRHPREARGQRLAGGEERGDVGGQLRRQAVARLAEPRRRRRRAPAPPRATTRRAGRRRSARRRRPGRRSGSRRPCAARRCAGRGARRCRAGRRRPRRRRRAAAATERICGLVEVALQRLDHVVPGVALVRHEGEGGGQRRRLAVAVLDRAVVGGRVLVAGDLGQEARHLDVGLRAGAEPAVDLQDHLVAEGDRDVALLDAERARRRRARASPRRPAWRGS